MKLRRLTVSGIEQFATYISQLQADGSLDVPVWLLTDDEHSEEVAEIEVGTVTFSLRADAARYLDTLLEGGGSAVDARDPGMWSWLTLYWFDQLCPVVRGKRHPSREQYRYIPAVNNYQKYYRHLLLGPYVIYQAHKKHLSDAMALLAGPVAVINDVIEQIASRLEWVSNRAVVGVATKLYIDPETDGYKRGAGGKGGGSPRRLSVVLDQFDLTFDLYGMPAEDIVKLLPKEFDRFRKASLSNAG